MNRAFRLLVLGFAALPIALTGCSNDLHPAYSQNVKYGVRVDPAFTGAPADLGDERFDPDRPGVLPIMKLEDVATPDHPYFKKKDTLKKAFLDTRNIKPSDYAELEKELEATFGTPANPTVKGVSQEVVAKLQLDDKTLAMGSTRYRIHCLHCHGVSGDGRGPTARWINPHPRDFRLGVFKFRSNDVSKAQSMASRDDLERTVRMGIEGTAMPSFNLLADDEINSIVSYVIHLSIRGRTEYNLYKSSFVPEKKKDSGAGKDDDKTPKIFVWEDEGTIGESITFQVKKLGNAWLAASDPANRIVPTEYQELTGEALKESMHRGKQLFTAKFTDEFKKAHALNSLKKQKMAGKKDKDTPLSKEDLAALEKEAASDEQMKKAETVLKGASCVTCHVDYGRQARFRFDDWGTLARPNNFMNGNFRGGKRPIDIYYRIHSGIPGSGMQPFHDTFPGNPEYLWDLVNFVRNLSYPHMRNQLDLKID